MATYNVMTGYGAANNNSTNDAGAINNAIAAANAAGGGTVFFPSGAGYRVLSALTTPYSEVTLAGEGWEASKIRSDFNGDTLVLANSESQMIQQLGFQPRRAKTSGVELKIYNCISTYVEDVNIFDDLSNGYKPYQGISIESVGNQYKQYITRLQVNGADREGGIVGNGGGLVQGVWFDDCEFARCYDGVLLLTGGGIIFDDCEFLQNRNHGIVSWVNSGCELGGLQINGGFSDSNSAMGLALYSNGGYVGGIQLDHFGMASNGRGLDMGQNVKDVTITGCDFANNNTQGAVIDSLNVSIANSRFPRNSASATNTYDGLVLLANVRGCNLVGNRFGGQVKNFAATQRYGLQAAVGAQYGITGNVATDNITGGYALLAAPVVNVGNW